MPLYQLRFSSDGRLPLFPDERRLRIAVRRLVKVTRGRLAMFGFVKDHGHPAVIASTHRIGTLRGTLRRSLESVAAQPLEKVWKGRVKDRSHALSLLRYLLNQPLHHGIPAHPALWSGSCFLDLAGARIIDGLELRLSEVVSLSQEELMAMAGLPGGQIRPASDAEIRALGATRLTAAASAAFAADPELRGNDAPSVRARRVAACLARQAMVPTSEVAWAFGCSRGGAYALSNAPIEPTWEAAVRIRLGLEENVQEEIERDWYRRVITERAARKSGGK
jgi:hypothetical protein